MESCCRTAGEALMRDVMKLREIVIESGRSMKKQWRDLTLFLLAFYLPFAIFTACILIGTMRMISPDDHFNPTLFLICGTLLLTVYVVLYYSLLASTILVVGAPFHPQLETEWTPKTILTAASIVWRMLLTDLLIFFILCFASFLFIPILLFTYMILINLVMSYSKPSYITLTIFMVHLEAVLFLVWVVHFMLTVSVVRPVAAIERLWGMAAIKRSAALLRGRTMIAITVLISFLVYVYANMDNRYPTFVLTFMHDGPKTLAEPLGFVLSQLGTIIFESFLVTAMSTIVYFFCRSTYDDKGLDLELPTYQSVPQSVSVLLKENVL